MNHSNIIEAIFRNLELKNKVSINDFKKCLVHISMYESQNNNTNSGNSRFVFVGMYAFKGVLASLVSKYIAGNGKQLQHFLGNAFSNENLGKIFDELGLEHVVSAHESVEIHKIKHVFALGYLGFVFQYCSVTFIEQTAVKYFLDGNEQYLPKTVAVNPIQILKAKAEQVLKQKIKIIETHLSDNLHNVVISVNLNGVIASHSSKSKLYAKKKAIKLALAYVLDKESESPEFKVFEEKKEIAEAEKQIREKALKQQKHYAFIKEKHDARAIEKERKRLEGKEREIRRVLNKKGAKNRVETPKKKEELKKLAKEMETMSAAKRRRIEDKLK
jgi:hypothetical protein